MNESQSQSANILDETLDDLADLPEWKPFPAGVHRVILGFKESKSSAGNPIVSATLRHMETLELKNPTDEPPKRGDETSVMYTLNQEIGQGKFKVLMKEIVKGLNKDPKTSLRKLIQECQSVDCVVVTQIRENKDKTQKFTDIVEIAFPDDLPAF